MTTVAFKDGILAADSMVTCNNGIFRGNTCKLWPVATEKGLIAHMAMAGHSGYAQHVLEWLWRDAPHNDVPKLPQGIQVWGIIAYTDRRLGVFSSDFTLQFVDASFHAQGSGNEIAMGAMAAGASAERAVEIACQLDAHSRLPVHAVNVWAQG